jgi:hypothetical protein
MSCKDATNLFMERGTNDEYGQIAFLPHATGNAVNSINMRPIYHKLDYRAHIQASQLGVQCCTVTLTDHHTILDMYARDLSECGP